jgi:hypothetical protein
MSVVLDPKVLRRFLWGSDSPNKLIEWTPLHKGNAPPPLGLRFHSGAAHIARLNIVVVIHQ